MFGLHNVLLSMVGLGLGLFPSLLGRCFLAGWSLKLNLGPAGSTASSPLPSSLQLPLFRRDHSVPVGVLGKEFVELFLGPCAGILVHLNQSIAVGI